MLYAEQRDDGSFLLHLPREGFEILSALPQRLRDLLESSDFEDRVIRRLFPIAYDDPEREREYRRLLGDDLRDRKLQTVDAVEKILGGSCHRRRRSELEISAEEFPMVLGFVNDMRVIIGTELDITEDGWEPELDPAHPRAEEYFLLHFLSYLEEALLQATGMVDLDLRPDDIC